MMSKLCLRSDLWIYFDCPLCPVVQVVSDCTFTLEPLWALRGARLGDPDWRSVANSLIDADDIDVTELVLVKQCLEPRARAGP